MAAYSTLVLVVLVALWLHAVRRHGEERPDTSTQLRRMHLRWLVGGGIVLPLASTALLLAFGIPAGHRMLPLPPSEGEALVIEVQARQWQWRVRYPHTAITLHNELHIPTRTPVDIHLTTADVIHGFWVPRLAGKLDAVPGRTNVLRLSADEPGVYLGQCTEFCGTGHAVMGFRVIAHTPEDYQQWRAAQMAVPGSDADG